MTSRLVLGCGSLAQALVDRLADRAGGLTVVTAEEADARTLREEGTAAETGDITDPETFTDRYPPESVVVATNDPERNEAAARAVRAAFPDSFLLAYAGVDPEPSVTAALAEVADEVLDPRREAADRVLAVAGNGSVRARKLLSVIRSLDGPLAVVAHDNPDPDAIASAVALARIAEVAGHSAEVCYFGEISHQENRAFVNLLDIEMRNLDPGADLDEYAGVALVDHSRPGVNDGLPEDTAVDVVIDHHPPREPVDARFVDLRSDVGATSTLMIDYLRRLDVPLEEVTATALLFGIRIDTDEFTREVSPDDFDAAAYVLPHADLGTLDRIDSPSMSADTLETIARAIQNRKRHGPALVSGVGRLSARDALAQAADRLLDLEDVTTTFVYGISEGTVYVSARARGADIDLGETLRDAFGQIGSAGGHADMAGAQLSLGLLDSVDSDDESLTEVVDAVITDRFLEAYDSRTNRRVTDVHPEKFHASESTQHDLPEDPGRRAGGADDEESDRDDQDSESDREDEDSDGDEEDSEDGDGRSDSDEGHTSDGRALGEGDDGTEDPDRGE
jgi:nanoRNase/pAp phosphatase (c-di-AMP/oligoRNAs hydrolase)